MSPLFVLVGLALASSLAVLGVLLDGRQPLPQAALFAGLQMASLSGAGLGVAVGSMRAAAPRQVLWLALAALVGWRLAYFPIMVFSGHVASIGEWLLVLSGLPIVVYPFFLLSVAVLHGAAAWAAGLLVQPPAPWWRLVAAPAFAVAFFVSFNQLSDLRPLPDTAWSLEDPIPPMRAEGANPYLPALTGEGYWPNQRIVLLAAGLTYETIPPSPWATTVKAVLEGLFHEKPFGSTRDRVLEHYRAYQSAHPQIGCRALADCPPGP